MPTTDDATTGLFAIARRAPFNIAPERGQKLADEIFGAGKWELRDSRTAANFYALPQENAVYLSYAGLASLWCLAYSAFQVMDIASRAQREPKGKGQRHIDIGQLVVQRRVAEHVRFAENLFVKDQDWPDDLPRPDVTASSSSLEGRINNVFFGALSWVILHEIAHVHHGDQKYIPTHLQVRQEYRADSFATEWILDEAGNGLTREFRVLVITVALTWLFLNERVVGQGNDHPPALLRFREAVKQFDVGERSVALENAAYILKALLDPQTVPPPHENAEDAFDWISGRLEVLFPPR